MKTMRTRRAVATDEDRLHPRRRQAESGARESRAPGADNPHARLIGLQHQIGNRAVARLMESSSSSVGAAPEGMIAQRTLGETLERTKRQIGRWWNKKKLPPNTYRWDDRKPDVIAGTGFQPWKGDGTLTLDEHVNNAFASGAKAGQLSKYESQWVSTGAYGMLKKLDPTFAQKVMDTHLYKVDTALASATGKFADANAHFDKIGKNRPYASQREWTKLGGVPAQAITEYMDGKDFINQYDMVTGAPAEDQLTNWKPMPTPAPVATST